MDFDDINLAGVVFALIGFGVGVLVTNTMGDSGLVLKLISGVVCAISCYFVGSKIAGD